MTESADSKHPIIQTWTLKIYCSCLGCEKKVKKALEEIKGVLTVTIDRAEQKATVTGTVACGDVLVNKLLKKCRKYVELCPVTQNKPKKESKTQIKHRGQNSDKHVHGDKKEHAAMARRKMQRNKANIKNRHREQNLLKDVGGDTKKHTILAQRKMQSRKPKDPKQQTQQKPGNDGGGNANGNAAVVQIKMRKKTLKRQKEQNSGRQEDNGQVVKDALFSSCPIVFTMEALLAATNFFHDDNKIGEGGFGHVFKGTTREGKQIAVKKLRPKSKQGSNEFLSETVLAKLQHRNIVKLLGFCEQRSEKLIVYEYFPNKSLDKWLSDREKRKELDWPIRYNIIQGIARGLSYLHEDSQPRIVHRDIKTANILLDEKLNPKITDFGLAKVFPEDMTYVHTGPVGTLGYLAPEYYLQEQLSPKADVYSFGIVLLELLTGKKMTSKSATLYEWLRSSDKGDDFLQMIDPTISETCDKNEASICIRVGLLCTQETPGRRPLMSQVTAMLTNSTPLILPPGSNAKDKSKPCGRRDVTARCWKMASLGCEN